MGAQLAVGVNNPLPASIFDEALSQQPPAMSFHKLQSTHRAIRILGTLYYVGAAQGVLCAIVCDSMVAYFASAGVVLVSEGFRFTWFEMALCTVYWIAWAALLMSVAAGLKKFDRRSANWAKGISIFAMLAVPLGTIVGLIFLVTLENRYANHLFENGGQLPTEPAAPLQPTGRVAKKSYSLLPVVLLLFILLLGGLMALVILV